MFLNKENSTIGNNYIMNYDAGSSECCDMTCNFLPVRSYAHIRIARLQNERVPNKMEMKNTKVYIY